MPIKPNKGTQQDRLLRMLRAGKVTSIRAFRDCGITSLHRRLTDLREMGWEIADSWEENEETGSHFKSYRLVDNGKDVA